MFDIYYLLYFVVENFVSRWEFDYVKLGVVIWLDNFVMVGCWWNVIVEKIYSGVLFFCRVVYDGGIILILSGDVWLWVNVDFL